MVNFHYVKYIGVMINFYKFNLGNQKTFEANVTWVGFHTNYWISDWFVGKTRPAQAWFGLESVINVEGVSWRWTRGSVKNQNDWTFNTIQPFQFNQKKHECRNRSKFSFFHIGILTPYKPNIDNSPLQARDVNGWKIIFL